MLHLLCTLFLLLLHQLHLRSSGSRSRRLRTPALENRAVMKMRAVTYGKYLAYVPHRTGSAATALCVDSPAVVIEDLKAMAQRQICLSHSVTSSLYKCMRHTYQPPNQAFNVGPLNLRMQRVYRTLWGKESPEMLCTMRGTGGCGGAGYWCPEGPVQGLPARVRQHPHMQTF